MGRKAVAKGAVVVERIKTVGTHAVGGVDGLALQVLPSGGRSWILRVMVGGKRRSMGLGGFPDVPLTKARDKAREARDMIGKGIDPIEASHANKRRLKEAKLAASYTFEKCVTEYLKGQEGNWKNAKSPQQWKNTLATYAFPVMGDLQVGEIEQSHVLRVLDPIWKTKTETAKRLRGRIEAILDWAAVRGLRPANILNPARWRGHLSMALLAPSKASKVQPRPALPITQVGAFIKRLDKVGGMGARALHFAILNASRASEVTGAVWSEFDFDENIWTIPASRMKSQVEHRIPLADDSIKLLKSLPHLAGSDYVFHAPRGGRMSDATMSAVIQRINEADGGIWIDPKQGCEIVPHGFRSTFCDWGSEYTNHPSIVVEKALAHAIADKVEEAYRRGDLFNKRRRLMATWAKYCAMEKTSGEVIPITRANQA